MRHCGPRRHGRSMPAVSDGRPAIAASAGDRFVMITDGARERLSSAPAVQVRKGTRAIGASHFLLTRRKLYGEPLDRQSIVAWCRLVPCHTYGQAFSRDSPCARAL